MTVYGTAQNLSASYTAGMNVTYADVTTFDQQTGNIMSGATVLFNYGSYPGATTIAADDPADRSTLQIGPSFVQGANITTQYTFTYANLTYSRSVSINYTSAAQVVNTAPPPGRRLAEDVFDPCSTISYQLFKQCQNIAVFFDATKVLSTVTLGPATFAPTYVADVALTLTTALNNNFPDVVEASTASALSKALGILGIFLNGLNAACAPFAVDNCQARNPGCTPFCETAPVQKEVVFSENQCINICAMQYPYKCCELGSLAGSICSAIDLEACYIGCGVCGLNGWP